MKTEARSRRSAGLIPWLEWGTQELGFLGEREAREECEQILEALFGVSRVELYLALNPEPLLYPQYSQLVRARKKRTPLAYLLGKAPFWDEAFKVEKGIFIPRPETETLVETFLKGGGFSKDESFHFLDLGTGSGNIAVILARLFPRSHGAATDLSFKALRVAEQNAACFGVAKRLFFLQADGLSAFEKGMFDVIFSNPPYVASREWETLEPEVHEEPRLALDGGEEGLEFYGKILRELRCLKPGGSLWVEIGWGQAPSVQSLFEKKGFRETHVFNDLNHTERIVSGKGFCG